VRLDVGKTEYSRSAGESYSIGKVEAILCGQLSRKQAGSSLERQELNELLKHTVAVDGVFLNAVAEVARVVATQTITKPCGIRLD
jgi:hypothetical protein